MNFIRQQAEGHPENFTLCDFIGLVAVGRKEDFSDMRWQVCLVEFQT